MHFRELHLRSRAVAQAETLDSPVVPVSGLITASLISANLWMVIAYGVWSLMHLLH